MIPGSVHDVKFKNKVVSATAKKKSIGIAGLTFHIFSNINIP